MVNGILDADVLGLVLAGNVDDVVDGASLGKAAHVHLAAIALDGLEQSVVGKLPQYPLVADVGLVAAVLGDEQGTISTCSRCWAGCCCTWR